MLASILSDASLAEFDLKGENVFYLPENSCMVIGVREALEKLEIIEEGGNQ